LTNLFRQAEFTSWGRVLRVKHWISAPKYRDEVAGLVAAKKGASILAVGMGRSYGDSGLNSEGSLIDMASLDRIISFDPSNGILRAEAGITIDEVLRIIVAHGWFLPTTPGSRFVSLGGAVANDVHGKNHHAAGSFGCSIKKIGLVRSNSEMLEIGPDDKRGLFAATIGGLGLTGVIVWVELQLSRISSAYLSIERIPFSRIGEFFELAASSIESHEHTVAWIDCANGGKTLGRGVFQRANWCTDNELSTHKNASLKNVPFDAPGFTLNNLSIKAFNTAYWYLQKSGNSVQRQHYGQFFYPLDGVRNWNRLYGKQGFYQYQCAVPSSEAQQAMTELLDQIVAHGGGSFLAVLKTFGNRTSPGLLSFPIEGATLALDFPNRGETTLSLLERLDRIVAEAGGRLYPAKDGRISPGMFRAGYGSRIDSFVPWVDPAFSSDFWRRVAG
jgi:FAD/FMN-containing dehydrogenase